MFVRKKKMVERLNDQAAQNEGRIRLLEQKFAEEREFLTKDLPEIINKLSRISIVGDYERNTFRVVYDIEPHMMTVALERGNDNHAIEYIGDFIRHKVVKAIKTCNIMRPDEIGLGRRG